MKIDQNLQVALAAGSKNNVFIYHAPQATVTEAKKPPEGLNGPTQMLYAVCSDLLECGITWKQWKVLSRTVMLQAGLDKYSTQAKFADTLNVARSFVTKLVKEEL